MSRLKSALLPTFGRPTIATVAGWSIPYPSRSSSAEHAQPLHRNLGCQMNEAESHYIAQRATSAGYTVAAAAEEANVVVLNTCTVRDNAERRAYGRMNHFKALKAYDRACGSW